MKKKFRKLLSEKCKDMGLTDKALDDLVEIGAEGLARRCLGRRHRRESGFARALCKGNAGGDHEEDATSETAIKETAIQRRGRR